MTTTEQIDAMLRATQLRVERNLTEETLLSLADLSVSILRMIDARRERGIPFESSYNEQELRRALASMANQVFPPGPPMRLADRETSVLDEAHDFQRFEHVTLDRIGGWTSLELKVVCRCGWAATSIDRDPDEKIARVAARDLLAMHVTEAIDRAHKRKEPVR